MTGRDGVEASAGLYVHVPFCASRCGYCDFNTYAGLDEMIEEYLRALQWEMSQRSAESPPIRTIYVGGGTPTHLPQGALEELVRMVFRTFQVLPGAEATVEMNPGDADAGRLRLLRSAGVNRVSIGAQAFDDDLLGTLGRRHDSRQAADAVAAARRAGFENVSIDLIYAIPGQTACSWQRTLEQAVSLAPEHISAYGLTIEPRTPFARLREQGLLEQAGQDEEADMYRSACSTLTGAGYEHYEVSNFAMPGRRCLHNEGYWRGNEYVGIGAGAHSCLGGVRWWNAKHPRDYANLVGKKALPVAAAERLSLERKMQESIMTCLRLKDGVSRGAFLSRFGRDLADVYGSGIQQARRDGLVRLAEDSLALTEAGAMVGDRVVAQIVGGGDD